MIRSRHKKLIFIVFATLVLLGIGFLLLQPFSTQRKAANNIPDTTPASTVPRQITLEGEVVCLPHKDTTGPQTLECSIGIKDAGGDYYSLDTDSLSSLPEYKNGDKIRGTGLYTPIENLSSDHWQKYNVKGIFSPKGGIEIL